jgi:hypothetical protein
LAFLRGGKRAYDGVDVAFYLVGGDVAVFFEELAGGGTESRSYGVGVPWDVFFSGPNPRLGIWDVSLRHVGCCVSFLFFEIPLSMRRVGPASDPNKGVSSCMFE